LFWCCISYLLKDFTLFWHGDRTLCMLTVIATTTWWWIRLTGSRLFGSGRIWIQIRCTSTKSSYCLQRTNHFLSFRKSHCCALWVRQAVDGVQVAWMTPKPGSSFVAVVCSKLAVLGFFVLSFVVVMFNVLSTSTGWYWLAGIISESFTASSYLLNPVHLNSSAVNPMLRWDLAGMSVCVLCTWR